MPNDHDEGLITVSILFVSTVLFHVDVDLMNITLQLWK